MGAVRLTYPPMNSVIAVLLGIPGLGLVGWGLGRESLEGHLRPGVAEWSQESGEFRKWVRPRMLSGVVLYCCGIGAWMGSVSLLALTVFMGVALLGYGLAVCRAERGE